MSSAAREAPQPALRVARGASYLVIQGLIINLTSVIFFAFAARQLPTIADLGRFTTLNTLGIFLIALGTLGLPTAGVRFVAKYIADKRETQANSVYRTLLVSGTILSTIILVATLLAGKLLSTSLLGSTSYLFLIELAAIDAALQLITVFPIGALQGKHRFRESATVLTTSNTVQFAFALYFLETGLGLTGILYGWIIGDGLGAILALAIGSRQFSLTQSSEPVRALLRYSLPVYGSNLAAFASNYLDRFLVLFFLGTTSLGIYTPAVVAASVLAVVSVPIASALLPQLQELHTKHGDKGFVDAARGASRYLFIIMLPLAIGLAATSQPTIVLFTGQRYSGGTVPLIIVSLAIGLTSASSIVNTCLLVLGRTRVLLIAGLLGVIGEIATSPLIPVFGIDAAATSRTALLFVSLATSWLLLRKSIKNVIDLKAMAKVLSCTIVEAAAVLTVETVWYHVYLLPLYIAVGGLAYLITLRYIRILRKDDISLLQKLVPAQLRFLVRLLQRLVRLSSDSQV